MNEPSLKPTAENEMRCPTCNARQTWSDECRRCKCDLSLLWRCWRTREAERRRCLRRLRAGQPDQALRHARRYAIIVGAAEASRLLAVCLLLCDNWPDARAVADDTRSPPLTEAGRGPVW